MKYRYRNRKTGEMISTTNRIGGKNWERVEEAQNPFVEDETIEEEIFEEESSEEETAEEAPAEKPKTSRRSKK